MQELLKRLQEKHGKCAEALTQKSSTDTQAATVVHTPAAEEDVSGLTFQEWTPDVDTSRPPVAMLINSSELRVDGFKLKEVIPPALESQLHVVT